MEKGKEREGGSERIERERGNGGMATDRTREMS